MASRAGQHTVGRGGACRGNDGGRRRRVGGGTGSSGAKIPKCGSTKRYNIQGLVYIVWERAALHSTTQQSKAHLQPPARAGAHGQRLCQVHPPPALP